MKKQLLFLLAFALASTTFFSQEKKISDYEFIIVPQKFGFLKKVDQYQTSSLTKFLLKKNGFTVILDSEQYPEALKKDRCKALLASVVEESSMFKTKVSITFKDCFNKVVYTSKVGTSKLKDFKGSYQEAIRNAHQSMEEVVSNPLKNSNTIVQAQKTSIPKESVSIHQVKENVSLSTTDKNILLYAQPIKNGYQLIDKKPAVLFIALKTSVPNYYILKDKAGVLFKKDELWFVEYYNNDTLISKEYQIKF